MSKENPRQSPRKKNETPIRVGEREYPTWIVEQAQWVMERAGGTLEEAIRSLGVVLEAAQTADHADQNEPTEAAFPPHSAEDIDDESSKMDG